MIIYLCMVKDNDFRYGGKKGLLVTEVLSPNAGSGFSLCRLLPISQWRVTTIFCPHFNINKK